MMTLFALSTLPSLMAFAFVSSITPGPNNLMLMASGANFGYRRTLPHMMGVAIGFTAMVALVGLGLMQLFDAFPLLHRVLTVASVAYLLWLAWKIANAAPPDTVSATTRPFTFLQAAAFQWVNPKAWTMALTAITLYAADRSLAAIILIALTFGAVNLPCISTWVLMGTQIRRLLSSRTRLRVFNGAMALLLVGSLYPTLVT